MLSLGDEQTQDFGFLLLKEKDKRIWTQQNPQSHRDTLCIAYAWWSLQPFPAPSHGTMMFHVVLDGPVALSTSHRFGVGFASLIWKAK